MQVTIDISDKFAAVIGGLSEAIRGLSSINGSAESLQVEASTKVAAPKGGRKTEVTEKAASTGPIYWADNSTGYFGKVDTQAEYDAKKAAAEGVYQITESIYNEKTEALKAKNAEEAAAKKKAEAAAKKEAAVKKEAATEKTATGPAEHPTVEELVAVFARYLPKDLSKDERAERASFVRPLLERFGAAKASELLPEHRALAMNLVERKMAGEDIDPTSSDFAEVCAESEEDMI